MCFIYRSCAQKARHIVEHRKQRLSNMAETSQRECAGSTGGSFKRTSVASANKLLSEPEAGTVFFSFRHVHRSRRYVRREHNGAATKRSSALRCGMDVYSARPIHSSLRPQEPRTAGRPNTSNSVITQNYPHACSPRHLASARARVRLRSRRRLAPLFWPAPSHLLDAPGQGSPFRRRGTCSRRAVHEPDQGRPQPTTTRKPVGSRRIPSFSVPGAAEELVRVVRARRSDEVGPD